MAVSVMVTNIKYIIVLLLSICFLSFIIKYMKD